MGQRFERNYEAGILRRIYNEAPRLRPVPVVILTAFVILHQINSGNDNQSEPHPQLRCRMSVP